MRRKCYILAVCCFVLALAIYVFTHFMYHHVNADGIYVATFQETAGKPFITLLFGILGVIFHFAGILSILIGKIFFPKTPKEGKSPARA